MAQVQRKLVHKQFNSPIGLYSNNNVKETLDRELKTLNNGAVGIDFDDPSTTRTGNLAKSAVLAALEEEERERSGQKPGLKRVAWPPNLDEISTDAPNQSATVVLNQPQPQPQVAQTNVYRSNSTFAPDAPITKSVAQQQPRPLSIHGFNPTQAQDSVEPLSPLPQLQVNPSQSQQVEFQAASQIQSPIFSSPRGWNHVNPPRSPGANTFYNNAPVAPSFESNTSINQPQYQSQVPVSNIANVQPRYEIQPEYVQPAVINPVFRTAPQQPFQGSPLRKEAPITQRPAPIYQAQPVASTFQGGANRRGDTKWPPSEVKQQSEIDNEARRQLALGPNFRPKRVNRDYSGFFAQNALTATYPGYRVPPGTLHINE